MDAHIGTTTDGNQLTGLGDRARREDPPSAVAWSAATMIERLGGDEDLARQLVALFVVESPKLMSALRDSVLSGNADSVRRAAHAAKGCIANFIDDGPQATAYRIEQLGGEGRLDAVPALVAQLEHEVDALVRQMTSFEQGR